MKESVGKKQLFQDILNTGLLKIIGISSSFLLSAVLARNLDPKGFGNYSYLISVLLVIMVPIQFGLPKYVMRVVSETKQKGCLNQINKLISTSHIIITMTFGLLCLLSLLLPSLLGQNTEIKLYSAVIVLGSSFNAIYSAILRGLGHSFWGNFDAIVIRPALLLVMVLVVGLITKVSMIVVLRLYAVNVVVGYIFNVFILYNNKIKVFGIWSIKILNRVFLKELLPSTLPLLLVGVVDILSRNLDVLLLGNFVSPEELGVYKVAISFAWLLSLPRSIFSLAWSPHISASKIESQESFRLITNKLSNRVFSTSILVITLVVIFGENLIVHLYGTSYDGAYDLVLILAVGHFFNISLGLGDVVLTMIGKEKRVAIVSAFAVIINAFVAFNLIPIWGIYGAAVGTSIAMILMNVLLFYSMYIMADIIPNPLKFFK